MGMRKERMAGGRGKGGREGYRKGVNKEVRKIKGGREGVERRSGLGKYSTC